MDALGSAAAAVILGVIDGALTAAFLALVYAIARFTYRFHLDEFESKPAQADRTLWQGFGIIMVFALLVTLGAKYVPRLECIYLRECAETVSRSDEEKIAIFTTTFLVFAGTIVAANVSAKRSKSEQAG